VTVYHAIAAWFVVSCILSVIAWTLVRNHEEE
jgi:hypothetical protein